MIDICLDCCHEWEHPGDTSIPLQIEDILRELKKTEKEIELINEETSNLKYFDFIMPSI
jgi:endonuclease IV